MTDRDAKKPAEDGKPRYWDRYVYVYEDRAEGDTQTCLRPLNKCEMGMCCDVCIYNPDHPRYKKAKTDKGA